MKDINYSEIKLNVGLEIHQQLAIDHKLFCNCEISNVENNSDNIEGFQLFDSSPSYKFKKEYRLMNELYELIK